MIVILLASIVVLYLSYHLYWKRRNLPPGPLPLPFLGNVLQFYYYGLDKVFTKFKQDFGDLHTIWFGNTPVISVNDVETIYNTFVKDGDSYSGREINPKAMEVIKGGYAGIVFTDGVLWHDQRKFATQVLREFGLGQNLMQERVLQEVDHMIEDLKNETAASGRQGIDLQSSLDIAVGSVINTILLGYRFDKSKAAEFHAIKKYVSDFIHHLGNPLWKLMEYNPDFYKYLPFFRGVYQKLCSNSNNLACFLYSQIDSHAKSIDFEAPSEPTDYVEAFLRKQRELEKQGSPEEFYSRLQLYGSLQDMWVAGQETSAKTLTWLSLYLVAFPEIQEKLQRELDEKIGSDRLITLDDKVNLPYCNAVILESQRYSNLGTFNLLRRTLKPVEIHGYKLPPHTLITYASHTINMDERYFPEPEKFDPERFLDSHGRCVARPEVMPYGVGKRSCIGEALARAEMFLFTANLFNQFRISQIEDKPISLERILGALASPKPFVVNLEPRF